MGANKELPQLLKVLGRKYFIGCDFAREPNDIEIFTYCIAYEEDGVIIFQDANQLINTVKYRDESPFEHYIETLSEFYKVSILTEEGEIVKT